MTDYFANYEDLLVDQKDNFDSDDLPILSFPELAQDDGRLHLLQVAAENPAWDPQKRFFSHVTGHLPQVPVALAVGATIGFIKWLLIVFLISHLSTTVAKLERFRRSFNSHATPIQ